MSKRLAKKKEDSKINQASSNLFRSLETQKQSYKNLSLNPLNKTKEYLEESIFNPKNSKKQTTIDSTRSLGQNDRFKFFQGDQSVFIKDFVGDQSKFYHDQSTILQSKDNLTFNAGELFNINEDESMQQNPKYQILKNIDSQLEELSKILKNSERDSLLEILDNLQEGAKEVKDNHQLLLKILELKGKILRDIGDYSGSVSVFKHARLYCNMSKSIEKKLYFYKILIDMYLQMREYNNALIYAKKLLRFSWIINQVDYEITAYDKIGIINYYNGNLVLADYFHERAYSNIREPKNSIIRKVGENILRNTSKKKMMNIYQHNNFDTDSEDDFDLGVFQNNFVSKRQQMENSESPSNKVYSKQNIPVPRKVNEHIRSLHCLGRVDITQEKRISLSNSLECKYIYNHMSLNRNLKNFMIQQYVNNAFWTSQHDQLSQIKFYHLHRNQKNHLAHINRIRKYNYTLKNDLKIENILQFHNDTVINHSTLNHSIPKSSLPLQLPTINITNTLNSLPSQYNLLSSQPYLPSVSDIQQQSHIIQQYPTKVSLIPTLPRILNNSIASSAIRLNTVT